jgi:hypothetical protein
MDNKMINIDDLVRQRLGGGEEKELPGAWLRMRELLDKEEERKPAAFIWRRHVGVLAALILASSLSLGGYKLSQQHNTNMLGSVKAPVTSLLSDAATPALTANEEKTIDLKPNSDNNNNNNNKEAKNIIAAKSKSTVNDSKNTPLITDNTATTGGIPATQKNGIAATAPTNQPASGAATAANQKVSVSATTKYTRGIGIAEQPNLEEAANSVPATRHNNAGDHGYAHKTGQIVDEHILAASVGTATLPSGVTGKSAGLGETSDNAKEVAIKQHKAKTNEIANKRNETAKTIAAADHSSEKASKQSSGIGTAIFNCGTGNPVAIAKNTATAIKREQKPTTHKGLNKTPRIANVKKQGKQGATIGQSVNKPLADKNAGEEVAMQPAKPAANSNKGKLVITEATKVSSHTSNAPAALITKVTGTIDGHILATSVNKPLHTAKLKLPVSNPVTASKGSNGVHTTAPLATNTPAFKKGNNPAVNTKTSTPASSTAASKTNGGSGVGGPDLTNLTGTDKLATLNTRRGKKIVEKITIHQRMIQVTPNTYQAHLDTISIETINEEFEIKDSDKTPTDGKSLDGTTAKNAGEEGATAGKETNVLKVPGVVFASAKKSTDGVKEEQTTRKKGAGKLESLQSAFNDIKYKINGTQFAMGLTGGVNGTFFGPNSFKGIQFGITGNFIFSESLNIMAELKYFHRANSDYSLNDDYYTYTPTANNTWDRETQQNAYSFSTLHSFEMPLAVRYSLGKFNFFGGANLVYAFAINEAGGPPRADPTSIQSVFAPGNDTASKIKTDDFKSKFGVGYLFGASVQLMPNLSLDVREVQTIWDNAKTIGAKQVSSQLYRSPSFQLSIAYRFSSKKGKDKE